MTPWTTRLLPIVAVVAIAGAVALGLRGGDEPEAVTDLRRAREAGEQVGSASRRIVENLERIESNLRAGADISEKGSTIHDLTTRQQRSLENLVGLLREQLDTLRRTKSSLEGTRRSASEVGELGAEQLRILQRTFAALEDLKADVGFATRTSGELSRLALYGARLAEDSQRRFEGP